MVFGKCVDFRDANVSTLGFDKSKVTCFRCREKGHFKRECKGREASGAQNPFGKMITTAKLSINKLVNPRNLRQLTEEKLKIPREHVW